MKNKIEPEVSQYMAKIGAKGGKNAWNSRKKKIIEQSKKILSRAAHKKGRGLPPPVIGGAGLEKHDY